MARTTRILVAVAAIAALALTMLPASAHTDVMMMNDQNVPIVAQSDFGHEINWENMDAYKHNVAPYTAFVAAGVQPFPVTSPDIAGGASWGCVNNSSGAKCTDKNGTKVGYLTRGNYAYQCTYHTGQIGILVIT